MKKSEQWKKDLPNEVKGGFESHWPEEFSSEEIEKLKEGKIKQPIIFILKKSGIYKVYSTIKEKIKNMEEKASKME